MFKKKTRFFYLKVPLCPFISLKNIGGIRFSEPQQQFSESDNFGPLGVGGGGVHRDVYWPMDYKLHMHKLVFFQIFSFVQFII